MQFKMTNFATDLFILIFLIQLNVTVRVKTPQPNGYIIQEIYYVNNGNAAIYTIRDHVGHTFMSVPLLFMPDLNVFT